LITTESTLVSSGIPSLDKILGGGFQSGDTILLAGQPGAGKTTLGLQFLYDGATNCDEPGIYVSFVESVSKLKRNAVPFGWDLEALDRSGKLRILDMLQTTAERGASVNLETILQEVSRIKAKRIVIDSFSAMTMYIESIPETRSFAVLMNKFFEAANCTTILMLEVPWAQTKIGNGFEEFLADGLIVMESVVDNFRVTRRLFVPKLRGANHLLDCYEFFISREGINISAMPMVKARQAQKG
jgi:circadian clock protein KaiC